MRVDQAMSAPAVTVTAATPVKRAAEVLASRGFTVLPVVDDELRLVGIVSEGDLVRGRFPAQARLTASPTGPVAGRSSHGTVGAVMSRDVLTATDSDDVHELIERMSRARVRAVPVLRTGLVVGVVTYQDLVRIVARRDGLIAAGVRVRLDSCFALGRFEVAVDAGTVVLTDQMDHPEDWHTARVIAEQVPGVAGARVSARVDSHDG